MAAKKMLKLSDQGVTSIMVAITNALIAAATDVEENADASKVIKGYQFFIDEDGKLSVKNPVVPFELSDKGCDCECGVPEGC